MRAEWTFIKILNRKASNIVGILFFVSKQKHYYLWWDRVAEAGARASVIRIHHCTRLLHQDSAFLQQSRAELFNRLSLFFSLTKHFPVFTVGRSSQVCVEDFSCTVWISSNYRADFDQNRNQIEFDDAGLSCRTVVDFQDVTRRWKQMKFQVFRFSFKALISSQTMWTTPLSQEVLKRTTAKPSTSSNHRNY